MFWIKNILDFNSPMEIMDLMEKDLHVQHVVKGKLVIKIFISCQVPFKS